jgi:hypothetical protein
MNAVSWRRQLPHIRHPKSGPFTQISTFARSLLPNVSFLNGKKAGCHLRAGLIPDIFLFYTKVKIIRK